MSRSQNQETSESNRWLRERVADLEAENQALRDEVNDPYRDARIQDLEAEVEREKRKAAAFKGWRGHEAVEARTNLTAQVESERARAEAAEAELEKLRSFPPCCYDGLGNEGRGCQLLTARDVEVERLREALEAIAHPRAERHVYAYELSQIARAALASLEGENG